VPITQDRHQQQLDAGSLTDYDFCDRVEATADESISMARFRFSHPGHGDLLFARDAPKLVWEPLADWLNEH
jgi:hypothetical protein